MSSSSKKSPITVPTESATAAPALPAAAVGTSKFKGKIGKKDIFDVNLQVKSLLSGETMVTIEPPAKGMRVPVDICCVVDVSGSMGSEATLKNADGDMESHGLSVLDVAKHSVQTIIQMLGAKDRLSLVTYSTTANVAMSLCAMNSAGKRKAKATVEKMHPDCSTNIWAGLMKGLQDLQGKRVDGKGRYQCILLLTDGQPNISPPRGEAFMLKKFQDSNPEMKCVVHTFGFGYNLNTALLQQLAEVGGGSYSFIPDASLVGTVFVNAASNILVTQSHHAQLRLTPLNGAKFSDGKSLSRLPKGLRSKQDPETGTVIVDVGAVHFGQPSQVMFNMSFGLKGKPHLKAELVYTPTMCAKKNACRRVMAESSLPIEADTEISAQVARYLAVDCIMSVIKHMNNDDMVEASSSLADAVKQIKNLPHDVALRDPRVADTCKDLLGQVKEAISRKDFFQRWGRHYLPSLAQAHLQQCCNNFKDPGVQHYGGKDFGEQRDIADEIFCKMDPPKPSIHTPAAAQVKSMNTYYNCSGGCFHGDCSIKMADGSYKPLRDVRRGDKVLTGAGTPALVACVTRTRNSNQKIPLVRLPDSRLYATPYHPVKVGGRWAFPCDIGVATVVDCNAVFNLLLADGHSSMVIEDVECVSLGHGLVGDVVGHDYFGNRQAIVGDLEKMPGWTCGMVDLCAGDLQRDAKTNKVVAIRRHVRHTVKQIVRKDNVGVNAVTMSS